MKRILFSLLSTLAVLLSGCATMMTGMTSATWRDAPLALAYSDLEIIRDQDKVTTLVILSDYGLAVDGVLVKAVKGAFNSDLRVSKSGNPSAYIVDLPPGARNLTIAYDGIQQGGALPPLTPSATVGSTTISAFYSGPLPGWIRTTEITRTFKAGEIYAIGMKLLAISGDVELYPLDAGDRGTVIEARNNARF